jgi:hypothetical protein
MKNGDTKGDPRKIKEGKLKHALPREGFLKAIDLRGRID